MLAQAANEDHGDVGVLFFPHRMGSVWSHRDA